MRLIRLKLRTDSWGIGTTQDDNPLYLFETDMDDNAHIRHALRVSSTRLIGCPLKTCENQQIIVPFLHYLQSDPIKHHCAKGLKKPWCAGQSILNHG